jgi:hypothetical protein
LVLLASLVPVLVRGDVSVDVDVAGSADPWLAGVPTGSTASCCPGGYSCSEAPAQSPPLAAGLCVVPSEALTFDVSGATAQDPHYPLQPPDGAEVTLHHAHAENGMSDLVAPISCLTGVFVDDAEPSLTPSPVMLDFTTPESRDYLTLAPELKQVFFIGDGRTSVGQVQQVIVPAGATRLFLGGMDCCEFTNNIGTLHVTVHEPCGPVPTESVSWSVVKVLNR